MLTLVNEDATSMCQSAEWGMRSLQASFPRIKDRILYEKLGERKSILEMLFTYSILEQIMLESAKSKIHI